MVRESSRARVNFSLAWKERSMVWPLRISRSLKSDLGAAASHLDVLVGHNLVQLIVQLDGNSLFSVHRCLS